MSLKMIRKNLSVVTVALTFCFVGVSNAESHANTESKVARSAPSVVCPAGQHYSEQEKMCYCDSGTWLQPPQYKTCGSHQPTSTHKPELTRDGR